MPNRFGVKFTYQMGQHAATETYWSVEFTMTNTGAAAFALDLQDLIDKRTNLMFDKHQWLSVELANVDNPRQTMLLRPGHRAIPPGGPNIVTLSDVGDLATDSNQRPEQMRVAAKVELTYDNGSRRSRRFMSTVPDDVTFYDPNTINVGGLGAWWLAFSAWRATLTSGKWFIRARSETGANSPRQVQKLLLSAPAPSLLGLQINAGDAPAGWVAGKRISLQNFRPVAGHCPCPTLNGRWVIDSRNDALVPGAVVIYLQGSGGIDPTDWKLMGKAQTVDYDYFVIEDAEVTGTSIHQRGNGSRQRGKRKTRCCVR